MENQSSKALHLLPEEDQPIDPLKVAFFEDVIATLSSQLKPIDFIFLMRCGLKSVSHRTLHKTNRYPVQATFTQEKAQLPDAGIYTWRGPDVRRRVIHPFPKDIQRLPTPKKRKPQQQLFLSVSKALRSHVISTARFQVQKEPCSNLSNAPHPNNYYQKQNWVTSRSKSNESNRSFQPYKPIKESNKFFVSHQGQTKRYNSETAELKVMSEYDDAVNETSRKQKYILSRTNTDVDMQNSMIPIGLKRSLKSKMVRLNRNRGLIDSHSRDNNQQSIRVSSSIKRVKLFGGSEMQENHKRCLTMAEEAE